MDELIVTIITSAAVGALASSIVNLVGQRLERQARRKELLLTKAIELAARRSDTVLQVAFKTGATATLKDDVFLVVEYYRELQNLIAKDDLSEAFKEKERASR